MPPLLLLPLLLPALVTACITWTDCTEATCFSKYASRNGLGVYALGDPAPTTGLALQVTKTGTRVSIQLEAPGMEDDDYAAIGMGIRRLGGCHKGAKKLELNTIAHISLKDPPTTRSYSGSSFCCVVEVFNLDVQWVDEPSSKPLLLTYSIGKTTKKGNPTVVELPTDFSAKMILASLEYRKNVACDVTAFRLENATEGVIAHYPFQDPSLAYCALPNYYLKMGDKFTRHVPICEDSKWYIGGKELAAGTSITCDHSPQTRRRSCAGASPPLESRCGKECGVMSKDVFVCGMGTELYYLDGYTNWHKADNLLCTARGYVAIKGAVKTLLSDTAMVQCKVIDMKEPAISFIAFSWTFAICIGLAIYAAVFGLLAFGCRLVFAKWRARVAEIGPGPRTYTSYGAVTSARTAQSIRSAKSSDKLHTKSDKNI